MFKREEGKEDADEMVNRYRLYAYNHFYFLGVTAPSSVHLILYTSLAFLGIGMFLPCLDAFITEGIEKEQRGTISSLYSSMHFVGVAAGPPISSILMGCMLFFTMSGTAAAAGLLAIIALKPKNKSKVKKIEPKKKSNIFRIIILNLFIFL